MKNNNLLAVLLLMFFGQMARASDSDAAAKQFQAGLVAYEAGNYKTAAVEWEEVKKAGITSAGIYHNLGNAYFRSKELGKAIFHYRSAWELNPRDPDTRYNLSYARGKVEDKIESKGFASHFSKILPISEKETYYLLAVLSVVMGGISILALFKQKPWLRWGQGIVLVFFVFSIGLVAQKSIAKTQFGVISIPESEVFSGTGADKILLFRLHDGAEFSIEGSETEGWFQLTLADGKKGWVKKSDVVFN